MKEKTQVYNVVILDKSGSMSSIRRAAVDGFNETLAGIKKAQEKFSETQLFRQKRTDIRLSHSYLVWFYGYSSKYPSR